MDAKTRDDRMLQAVLYRSIARRYDKRAVLINVFAVIIMFTGHTGWAIFFGCVSVPFILMAFAHYVQADQIDPENHITYWKNDGQNQL